MEQSFLSASARPSAAERGATEGEALGIPLPGPKAGTLTSFHWRGIRGGNLW
ncbi:MAG: hypothetical protein WC423_20530 [Vulcanimicrobiota bacterium]